MSVGSKIKALRKEKDWTLRELARRADISHTFLSDIENNRSQPSLNRLRDIARALNVKVSYLLGEEGHYVYEENQQKYLPVSNPELAVLFEAIKERKDLINLLKVTKELDPDVVQHIIKITKTFINK